MNNHESGTRLTPELPLWSYRLERNSKLLVRTRKQVETQLLMRALKDAAFRDDLLTRPKDVLGRELGVRLPEDLVLDILEESGTVIFLVLPLNPYEGIAEADLAAHLGMTLEDIAAWMLDQQRNGWPEEAGSARLIARAWREANFKRGLLLNPRSVLAGEWQTPIPPDIEVRAFEETAHHIYIVLPQIEDDFLSYTRRISAPEWLEANLGDPYHLYVIGTTVQTTCTTTISCGGIPECQPC